jgi:hypothetical protein
VALEEVEQALYAPVGLRFERRIGDLLVIVMGMAYTGRVIAFCAADRRALRPTGSCGYARWRVRSSTSGGGESDDDP